MSLRSTVQCLLEALYGSHITLHKLQKKRKYGGCTLQCNGGYELHSRLFGEETSRGSNPTLRTLKAETEPQQQGGSHKPNGNSLTKKKQQKNTAPQGGLILHRKILSHANDSAFAENISREKIAIPQVVSASHSLYLTSSDLQLFKKCCVVSYRKSKKCSLTLVTS